MKSKHFLGILLVMVLTLALSGCAHKSMGPPEDLACANDYTTSMLKSGDYQKKVENFLIIQDASSSMGDKATTMNSSHAEKLAYKYDSKLAESKDLVKCLNSTLPENFDVYAGLRGFGPFYSEKGLVYGMSDYSKDALDSAIGSFGGTGGVTPIANALIHGSYDLLDNSQRKAVILFSDGVNTAGASPAAAAASMKEMHGDKLCIYTVLLGNDPKGRATMEQIADAGKCGFAIDSTAIGNAQGMDQFVKDVFLERAPEKPAPVMKKPVEMISITLFIEFDFDKDVVRPQHHSDVKKISDTLSKYSEATVQLEGHTDSMGTDAYNMDLSKRRADNVKKYLVDKFNVKASRITTVGYGESKPIASNENAAGRQRNRRVVANIE